MSLFHVKPLDRLVQEAEHGTHRLRRSLGTVQLTGLGIGVIVGAGIFSDAGTAVAGGLSHPGAGRALVVSYVLVGAIVSMASVLLVFPPGQPRIFFSMARDGLLPGWAAPHSSDLPHAAGDDDPHRRLRGVFRGIREHQRSSS
jgi:APA family basic amino acid/polyamine antiporter